jgi:hypothetical protein
MQRQFNEPHGLKLGFADPGPAYVRAWWLELPLVTEWG